MASFSLINLVCYSSPLGLLLPKVIVAFDAPQDLLLYYYFLHRFWPVYRIIVYLVQGVYRFHYFFTFLNVRAILFNN